MAACLRFNSSISLPSTHTLFLELHGCSTEELIQQTRLIEEIASSHNSEGFHLADNQEGIDKLWAARHNAYYAAMAEINRVKPGARGFTTDVCVPIGKLPDVLVKTREEIDRSGLYGECRIGHIR